MTGFADTGFVCPICGCKKYLTLNWATYKGPGVEGLFMCRGCTAVFSDPKKFSRPAGSRDILSQGEIDALLETTGSPALSEKSGEESQDQDEEPLVVLGRKAMSELFEELYQEILDQEDSRADFNIDNLARIIKERKEVGRSLTDSQTSFLSLFEESVSKP